MVRISICNSCKWGDHHKHRRTIQGVPKGFIGGVVCGCQGECKDDRYRPKPLYPHNRRLL